MDEGVLLPSKTPHLAWKFLLLERARAGKVPLKAFSYPKMLSLGRRMRGRKNQGSVVSEAQNVVLEPAWC